MTQRVCTNKGCGKSFNEAENSETACEHHAQGPVFHEGLKGWGCCSKRVTEFNDFLKIPGCAVGPHRVEEVKEVAAKPVVVDVPRSVVDGKEVYGVAPPKPAATPAVAPAVEVKPEVKEEDLHDPVDAIVEVGTACKRKGCKHVYKEGSKDDECVFHGGVPVFHEGSKGWTCCPRKVLEFDEFLKLQGCKRGKHRFLEQQDTAEVATVQCRHDWYQTPSTVIVSIFAKKSDKEKTRVTFTPNELRADIKFQDGKQFLFKTPLSLPIIPEESKYTILGTKIEIVLKKANGLSWPSLDPQENVVAWTTFGVQGGVGTVGSKQAIIAQDAPIHLMKKK
ncbi:HSP20-like chaperone [Chytridium lagenaria]|nr:HSP20-like chaperone [Chytridium lagenaria]